MTDDVMVDPSVADTKDANGKRQPVRVSKKSPQVELEPVLSLVVEAAMSLEPADRKEILEAAIRVILEADEPWDVYHKASGKTHSRHPNSNAALQAMQHANGQNDLKGGEYLMRPSSESPPEPEPAKAKPASGSKSDPKKKPSTAPKASHIAKFLVQHAVTGKKSKLTKDTHIAYHAAHKIAHILHHSFFAVPGRR